MMTKKLPCGLVSEGVALSCGVDGQHQGS